MRTRIIRVLSLFLPLLLVTAVTDTQAGSRQQQLAQFEKFAGAPVKDFRYFQLIGFQTLADNTVAVWTGVNKVYLIKLQQPCPDLDFARALSLSNSQANVFSARFDSVNFADTRCMVDNIRPVDYKALRQDRKKDAQANRQSGPGAT